MELMRWLEWAGAKLLSLNIKSPLPSGHRTAWPSFAQDANTAYGYTGERLRPGRATSREITLMDEILALTAVIPDITVRRIVNARCLVTPVSDRHLYSWTKLALMLHMDRRRVAKLYEIGIENIVLRVERNKIDVIRQTFIRLSINP